MTQVRHLSLMSDYDEDSTNMSEYILTMNKRTGRKVVGPTRSQKILSEKIKLLRDEKGVTVANLSKAAGLGRRVIYDMIDMKHAAQVDSLDAIAEALVVGAWTLLYPDADAESLEIITVFNNSDEVGKEIIRAALMAAKHRLARRLGDENVEAGNQSSTNHG